MTADDLDRRGFLRMLTSSALVGSLSTQAGCGGVLGPMTLPTGSEPRAVAAFCDIVDQGLAKIGARNLITAALDATRRAESPAVQRYAASANPMAQRALGTLHVVGALRDLGEVDQRHPLVQERLRSYLPQMDASAIEIHSLLRTAPKGERELVRRELGRNNHAMLIAEQLDREARQLGIAFGSRLKLRTAAMEVGQRLANQPPELLFNEYTTKVDRIAARQGIDLDASRPLATNVARDAFWHPRTLAAFEATQAPSTSVPPTQAVPTSAASTRAAEAAQALRSRGERTRDTGGVLLGIGGALFGISGGLVALSGLSPAFVAAGLFGGTVGLTLLTIGLVYFAIGASIVADEP